MNARFEGDWVVDCTEDCSDDWFPAHTKMRFLADFAFVDSRGYRWEAKAGEVIESVNLLFAIWAKAISHRSNNWSGARGNQEEIAEPHFIRSSVLYDVACQNSMGTSDTANRMVYEALLVEGAPQSLALLFYTAIWLYGPRWLDARKKFSNLLYHCSLGDYPLLRGCDSYTNPFSRVVDFDGFESALKTLRRPALECAKPIDPQ